MSSAAVILDAANDDEAIAQARHLVDGVGVEVWDRARRVVVLPPKGTNDEARIGQPAGPGSHTSPEQNPRDPAKVDGFIAEPDA